MATANVNQFSSTCTNSPAEPDNFERLAEEFAADPELQSGQTEAPPVNGGQAGVESSGGCFGGLSPEAAERWLEVPGNVLAKVFHNAEYKLQAHERDLMAEPLRVLINKHAPEVLKKSDSPEVTLLLIGALAYAARVGLMAWMDKEGEQKKEGEGEGIVQPPEKPKGLPPGEQPSPLIVASVTALGGNLAPLP